MYNKQTRKKTSIEQYQATEGEPIEMKVKRMVENKEPIQDSVPLNYTERNEGVRPEYNIRTDRTEIALDAVDKKNKLRIAAREEWHKTPEQKEAERMAKEAKEKGPNSGQAGSETT
jgi:hypothetical protein